MIGFLYVVEIAAFRKSMENNEWHYIISLWQKCPSIDWREIVVYTKLAFRYTVNELRPFTWTRPMDIVWKCTSVNQPKSTVIWLVWHYELVRDSAMLVKITPVSVRNRYYAWTRLRFLQTARKSLSLIWKYLSKFSTPCLVTWCTPGRSSSYLLPLKRTLVFLFFISLLGT